MLFSEKNYFDAFWSDILNTLMWIALNVIDESL